MTVTLLQRAVRSKPTARGAHRTLQQPWTILETYVGPALLAALPIGYLCFRLDALAPFCTLQHALVTDAATDAANGHRYALGRHDLPLLATLSVGWMVLRAVTMRCLLHPLARCFGIRSAGKQARFAEQGWLTAFHTSSWLCCSAVLYRQPHGLDSHRLWADYPHRFLDAHTKLLCMSLLAFWLLQLVVVHVEKRRKDHAVMVTHHLIAITLFAGSAAINVAPLSVLTTWCTDLADIFLSGAKTSLYAGRRRLADALFGLFTLSWFLTRHGLFLDIIYATWLDMPRLGKIRWEPAAGYLISPAIYAFFFSMLLILQALFIFWSGLLLRVIVRKVSGQQVTDSRSDDEGEGEEEEAEEEEEKAPMVNEPCSGKAKM